MIYCWLLILFLILIFYISRSLLQLAGLILLNGSFVVQNGAKHQQSLRLSGTSHGPFQKTTLPFAKTAPSWYTAILDACVLKDIRPTPNRIVGDYEIAIHNAVKLVISTNIHIQGCFYHLTQSTWRRVQAEGLQASYKDDEEVRTFCGMLDALAFLPVDRVNDGMRALKEVSPDDL